MVIIVQNKYWTWNSFVINMYGSQQWISVSPTTTKWVECLPPGAITVFKTYQMAYFLKALKQKLLQPFFYFLGRHFGLGASQNYFKRSICLVFLYNTRCDGIAVHLKLSTSPLPTTTTIEFFRVGGAKPLTLSNSTLHYPYFTTYYAKAR